MLGSRLPGGPVGIVVPGPRIAHPNGNHFV